MNEHADELAQARRDIVKGLSFLSWLANQENTLASRNVTYHADELMTWMDAFLSGREPADEPGDGDGIDITS
jgi:hypothetical protein